MARPEAVAPKIETSLLAPGLVRVKLPQGRGFFKIATEKKHGEASGIFLEINGARKFEIGNDCDTCHYWFKLLQEPRLAAQKKILNLPKTIQLPRPVDVEMAQEMAPLLDLFEKGEYDLFETSIHLAGPYESEDENSYFFNGEFHELWDVDNPKEEGLLSGWEHYESSRPRVFRHADSGIVEKQFDFIVPLINHRTLKDEYVKLYQDMIKNGDRPRILLFGFYQRPIPEIVRKGQAKTMHSFFSGFVLDGHHKLAAYRRAGVPAKFLTILSHRASKYLLLKDEGTKPAVKFDERLAALAAS